MLPRVKSSTFTVKSLIRQLELDEPRTLPDDITFLLIRSRADMDSGTVFYARQDHAYILNFVGDLRYTLTHSLATILDRLFQKGDFDNVLIDLTGAESVDRTILGLLSKIANFMRNRFGRKASIVSTNPDINQIPDSVGFFGVFSICSDLGVAAEAAHQLPVAGTILEAHDILSQLNERTVPCSRTWWKP